MYSFIKKLAKFIDRSRLIDDPLLCYAYATDASMYRMIPKLVILIENSKEVKQLLTIANTEGIALTFRAAGTSLSGQAITDQVLVVLSNASWQNYKISNNGKQITLEPGIIGATANLYLKPYNTKIGPDPASINSCKIGGIVANNSSGMCCGTAQNTYQTMQNISLTLANGSTLDTANEESKAQFEKNNALIIDGLAQIHQEIHANPILINHISNKFAIKNTSGYSLNAFIDYKNPIDILAHLIIGSEGTLGFINEITLNTVTNNQFKAVSLIYCNNLEQIIVLTEAIQNISIDAIELLDITSLISIKNNAKSINYLPTKLGPDTSAMLVEISTASLEILEQQINQIQAIIDSYAPLYQIKFTRNNEVYEEIWNLRKGIFPIVGGHRPPNSTVIIEDIAIPINCLPEVIRQLRELFITHNYPNAAIFGHILAGNIHFVFTPSFTTEDEIDNYDRFMQSITKIVINYQGSLKAEHGCGRNIASFVELEWGKTAYSIMWRIKNLLDPNNILNPEVILSRDPKIHLKNFKQLPTAHPIIDKCIECGFCEAVCPSKKLTFTPRQRISTYRYLKQSEKLSNKLYNKLLKQYQYYGIDTCATTGLCANQCPVGIDTGQFILDIQQKSATFLNQYWSNNFNKFIKLQRKLINLSNLVAKALGRKTTYQISKFANKHIPVIPIYPVSMPKPQNAQFNNSIKDKQQIIYIPSCNNRIFADSTQTSEQNAIHKLLLFLGYDIIYPSNLNNLCCGQVFDSNRNTQLGQAKQDELIKVIQHSKSPVLIDNSSCFYNVIKNENSINIINIIDIISNNLSKLNLSPKYNKLALHIDCSTKKLSYHEQILKILNLCAHETIIPQDIYCCGFAGKKGFNLPILNQVALSTLASQIEDCQIGVTFNRNCQIGLSLHGQKEYLSIAEIILNCLAI